MSWAVARQLWPACAVADPGLEALEEDAERGLRRRCSMEVACPLKDESAHAGLFAAIEPVAMTIGAGVKLQRVAPVVESVHRPGAGRTRPFSGVRLILDRARQDHRVADRRGFQCRKFVMRQPLAPARRTDVDHEPRM